MRYLLINDKNVVIFLKINEIHDCTFSQLAIEFDQFYDPDVLLPGDKYNVVDKYEYAVADNSTNGNVHTRWETITSAPSGQKVQWNLQLLYQLLKIPTCY